jgi:hypothetical protein
MSPKLKNIINIIFYWKIILGLGLAAFGFMKLDEIINEETWTALTWIGFGIWMYIAAIIVVMIGAMIFIAVKNLIKKWTGKEIEED